MNSKRHSESLSREHWDELDLVPTFLARWRLYWTEHTIQRWLRAFVSIVFILIYTFTLTGIFAWMPLIGTSTVLAEVAPGTYSQPTGGGTGGVGSPVDLGSSVTQPIPTRVYNGVTLPDWSKINLNSLPPMAASGKIEVPAFLTQQLGFDLNATWNEGDSITSVIKAGHLSDLGVGDMSLNQIDESLEQAQNLGNLGQLSSKLGNLGDAGQLSLADFDLTSWQSMTSLSEAILGLDQQLLGQVRPLADLASQALGGGTGSILDGLGQSVGMNIKIGDFMNQFPEIANLKLGESLGDLSQYQISEIPGLDSAQIGKLEDWQNSLANEIPGLGDLPLEEMNGFQDQIDSSTWAFIAKADVPLTTVEQERKETVSGSFEAGFQVPCDGENCAHMELTPIAGSQMDAMSIGAFANGKQWIAGTAQLVPGGHGALKAVAGGMEPTGRNPYGSAFKQIVLTVDEASGTVMTALFFRYCHPTLGCTPYILGPVPFLIYPEKMLVFLGLANPTDDLKGISLPGSPLRAGDGFKSCGGTMGGEAVDNAIKAVDRVASTNGAAFATSSANAQGHIPRILAALKEEGITCPAQVAYVLATVHGETSWVNFNEGAEGAYDYTAGGQSAHGRGYLQTTWSMGYERVKQEFGVDVVSNPDLLATDYDLMAKVLARGFKQGWYGKQQTIDEAIPCTGQVDYVGARWMINDADKASQFAQAATIYYDALSGGAGLDEAKVESGGCSGGSGTPKPCPEGQTCKMQNPLPNNTGVYSGYGQRSGRLHAGIDIQTAKAVQAYNYYPNQAGEDVLAAYQGTVSELVPVGGSCGGIVAINHPDLGLETRYVHLAQVFVKSMGEPVERGQSIGIEGMEGLNQGCAAGIHLHYEIYGGGTAVDPMNYANEHEPPLFYQ